MIHWNIVYIQRNSRILMIHWNIGSWRNDKHQHLPRCRIVVYHCTIISRWINNLCSNHKVATEIAITNMSRDRIVKQNRIEPCILSCNINIYVILISNQYFLLLIYHEDQTFPHVQFFFPLFSVSFLSSTILILIWFFWTFLEIKESQEIRSRFLELLDMVVLSIPLRPSKNKN